MGSVVSQTVSRSAIASTGSFRVPQLKNASANTSPNTTWATSSNG
jgi:hypothetical protein